VFAGYVENMQQCAEASTGITHHRCRRRRPRRRPHYQKLVGTTLLRVGILLVVGTAVPLGFQAKYSTAQRSSKAQGGVDHNANTTFVNVECGCCNSAQATPTTNVDAVQPGQPRPGQAKHTVLE
jgi:hypothetical protein